MPVAKGCSPLPGRIRLAGRLHTGPAAPDAPTALDHFAPAPLVAFFVGAFRAVLFRAAVVRVVAVGRAEVAFFAAAVFFAGDLVAVDLAAVDLAAVVFLAGAFFAAVFFAVVFFAVALVGAFFAVDVDTVLRAGAFVADTVLRAGVVLRAAVAVVALRVAAFVAVLFVAGAFFAAVFVAGAFFAVVLVVGAFFAAVFRAPVVGRVEVAFFAAVALFAGALAAVASAGALVAAALVAAALLAAVVFAVVFFAAVVFVGAFFAGAVAAVLVAAEARAPAVFRTAGAVPSARRLDGVRVMPAVRSVAAVLRAGVRFAAGRVACCASAISVPSLGTCHRPRGARGALDAGGVPRRLLLVLPGPASVLGLPRFVALLHLLEGVLRVGG